MQLGAEQDARIAMVLGLLAIGAIARFLVVELLQADAGHD